MANIEVSNLTGSNLLLDEETYLNELSDEVTTQTHGGTSALVCAGAAMGLGAAVSVQVADDGGLI